MTVTMDQAHAHVAAAIADRERAFEGVRESQQALSRAKAHRRQCDLALTVAQSVARGQQRAYQEALSSALADGGSPPALPDAPRDLPAAERALALADDAVAEADRRAEAAMADYAAALRRAEEAAVAAMVGRADAIARELDAAMTRALNCFDQIAALGCVRTPLGIDIRLSANTRATLDAAYNLVAGRFPPHVETRQSSYRAQWESMLSALLAEPATAGDAAA
jgi:hypothetical protein